MICKSRPHKHSDRRKEPFGIPSPARIRQLAAEIRSTWLPRTLARRAAQSSRGVELMVTSALEFADARTFCDK
jgi:hypothetical protein